MWTVLSRPLMKRSERGWTADSDIHEQERIHVGLQLEGAAEAVAGVFWVAVGDTEAPDCPLNERGEDTGVTKREEK